MSENSEKNIDALLGGGGFSSLLQNPDIAAKLPRIMEALAPVMAEMKAEKAAGGTPAADPSSAASGAGGAETAETRTSSAAGENPDAAAGATLAARLLSGAAGASGDKTLTGSARRGALLRALAPYLSAERQTALDYVIKVSSLIDVLSEVM